MVLNLTDLSDEPLHEQISRQLADKIVEGDIQEGDELKPIRTVAREQHVSVNTVRRAYENLEQDGLICAKEGSGFLVAFLTPEQKQAISMQRMLGSRSKLHVVEAFSKALISVFDPEKLRNIVSETLKVHMGIEEVIFCIYDDQQGAYVIPGSDPDRLTRLEKENALFEVIRKSRLPLKMELVRDRLTDGALKRELEEKGVKLILPLIDMDRCLGFVGMSEKSSGLAYTADECNLLMVLANQFLTAMMTARFYVEAVEKRRMEDELQMARQIQSELLPKALPDHEMFSVAARCETSSAVGGDFYDFISLDKNRSAFVIADGCGKGLPAAMLISQIQSMLRSELQNGNDIETTLIRLNRQVVRSMPKDKFITLFVGVYDAASSVIEFASAGHDHPFFIGIDGAFARLSAGGPALGLMKDAEYETGRMVMGQGDMVFLFTDGITETMDSNRDQYGEARLRDVLFKHHESEAEEIVLAVSDDVKRFSLGGNNLDDRTMLLFKTKTAASVHP